MKKIIAVFLFVLLLLSGLTGCVKEPVTPCNVAVVAAIAENNPVFDDEIEELAAIPSLPGSTYCVVSAESEPRLICAGEVPDLSDRHYTKTMLERVYDSIHADIGEKIAAASPASPEVDIAAATTMALRELHANHVDGREDVLAFYASMISTSGSIDMTDIPACELDVEKSVAELTEKFDWDMDGIRVVVYCCGDVAGDKQLPLSDEEVTTLRNFYQALFEAAGAMDVYFAPFLPPDGCYDFDQSVSVMRTAGITSGLHQKEVECVDLSSDGISDAFGSGSILVFPENTIAFQWNSTELEDPAAALNALAEVVAYMYENPDFELLICGTTTSAGEEESCIRFSEERAETISELLVSAGIGEERIHTLGCGYSSCLYEPDLAPDGTLDESIAPRNRSVKLVDSNSETAAEILASLPAR